MLIRRTWCLRQRVLWLEEVFYSAATSTTGFLPRGEASAAGSSTDDQPTPGDAKCGGSTAHNRDIMFIDPNRLGYVDGDGPGSAYITMGGSDDTTVPGRWTPIIIIREDNTTCISTNLSDKNGQMKELGSIRRICVLELCQIKLWGL